MNKRLLLRESMQVISGDVPYCQEVPTTTTTTKITIVYVPYNVLRYTTSPYVQKLVDAVELGAFDYDDSGDDTT